MKLSIGEKNVDLIVNGKQQTLLIKKAKLSDRGLSPDVIIKQAKEEINKKLELESKSN